MLDLMKFVHQRMGFAVENINALPGEQPDVAAAAKKYNDLLKQMATAQAAIEKAAPDADKAVAARGAQMDDDLAMVESWSKSLGNPQFLFDNKPDDAIAAVGQLPEMREAMSAMLQRWTARTTEKPNDKTAADMVRKLKYVDRQLTDLEKYTQDMARTLPDRIIRPGAGRQADRDRGERVRRPLYFGPQAASRSNWALPSRRSSCSRRSTPHRARRPSNPSQPRAMLQCGTEVARTGHHQRQQEAGGEIQRAGQGRAPQAGHRQVAGIPSRCPGRRGGVQHRRLEPHHALGLEQGDQEFRQGRLRSHPAQAVLQT